MKKAILFMLLIMAFVLGYLLGAKVIPSYISTPLSVIIGFTFSMILKTMD